MKNSSAIPLCVVLVISLVSAFGCDSSGGRQAIRGNITLQGTPLDEGVIEFVSEGVKSGTVISNGKYEIPAEQGLLPGTYKVLITSGDGKTPVDSTDGLPGPTGANIVSKDRIPADYNTNSKQSVTVTDSAPNQFDFAIP